MKRILFLFLLLALTGIASAQSNPPLTVQEVDGSPKKTGVTKIVVSNGTLTISGSTATITTGGGGGGITIGTTTIASGTTTRVLYNNGGTLGEYPVTGSTNVVMSASPTLTGTVALAAMTASGAITQTSASATAFESGPNGGTNPVFRLVNSTASSATGLSITGNAAGSGVTLTALSSGSNENIKLAPKGTGYVQLNTYLYALTGYQPALAFATDGSRGIGSPNSTTVSLYNSSQAEVSLGSGFLGVSANHQLGWASTSPINTTASLDTIMRRNAAANLAFGAADAAAPVAQMLSVQNVVGGTSNAAGANWTLKASAGTGTGAGGDLIIQTAPAGGSGTTQNSFVTAFTVKGVGAVQLKSVTHANLPTVADGYLIYCSDCTIASPCASGGSGALAKGINGQWVCN